MSFPASPDKKAKRRGLIIQDEDVYRLSAIGNILIKKAQPL
jgi:predicted transcriptional regulator